MKRIAIIGSREYPKPQVVRDFIETLPEETVVVTGGWWGKAHYAHPENIVPTRGVDRIAAQHAKSLGMIVVLVGADYDRYGKRAGIYRNPTIIDLAEEVAAFWDKKSPGTRNGLRYAKKQSRPARIFGPEGKEEKQWTQTTLL